MPTHDTAAAASHSLRGEPLSLTHDDLMFITGEPSQVVQPGTVTTNPFLHDIPPPVQATIPLEAINARRQSTVGCCQGSFC